MSPEDLRELTNSVLRELNEQGGQGVKRGGHLIPRHSSESPFAFAMRIARGNYEIPTSQTPPAPDEAKARAVREHNARVDTSRTIASSLQENVSRSETTVDESIESQISAIRRSADKWKNEVARTAGELRNAKRQLTFYCKLLEAATLEEKGEMDGEMDDGMPRAFYQTTRNGLLAEESQERSGSGAVGESAFTEGASSESERGTTET